MPVGQQKGYLMAFNTVAKLETYQFLHGIPQNTLLYCVTLLFMGIKQPLVLQQYFCHLGIKQPPFLQQYLSHLENNSVQGVGETIQESLMNQ